MSLEGLLSSSVVVVLFLSNTSDADGILGCVWTTKDLPKTHSQQVYGRLGVMYSR